MSEADALLKEARAYAERAIGVIDTIHLGPVDHNVANAIDFLRTAAGLVEDFHRERLR